jgi:hypothetical protein
VFDYWKKIDALNHMNRLLLGAVASLLIIVLGLLVIIALAPKRVEFWLTPSMMENGGLIQAGHVPKEYVHGFASTLIPTLNTWSKAGKKEFSENLQAFHYYFTPRFKQVMQDTCKAYEDAQFFNRIQTASLYRFMEPSDVKPIGKNTWEVHLLLRITQRLNNKSPMVIADKVVDYHFRIVKVAISKLHNPFELAIDGYTKPEVLVKDLLSQDKGDHADVD